MFVFLREASSPGLKCFCHSGNNYFLSTYCAPGAVERAGDTAGTKEATVTAAGACLGGGKTAEEETRCPDVPSKARKVQGAEGKSGSGGRQGGPGDGDRVGEVQFSTGAGVALRGHLGEHVPGRSVGTRGVPRPGTRSRWARRRSQGGKGWAHDGAPGPLKASGFSRVTVAGVGGAGTCARGQLGRGGTQARDAEARLGPRGQGQVLGGRLLGVADGPWAC